MGSSADEDATGPALPELDERNALITLLDALAHLWSRPVAAELGAWRDRPAPLMRGPTTVEEAVALLQEHDRLFVGPGETPCPPYESVWRRSSAGSLADSRQAQQHLAQLYRSLGLEVFPGDHGAPDHIAVEFEALAYALSSATTRSVARQLGLEHIVAWVPRLCEALALQAQLPFYRQLARLTDEVVPKITSYFDDHETEGWSLSARP